MSLRLSLVLLPILTLVFQALSGAPAATAQSVTAGDGQYSEWSVLLRSGHGDIIGAAATAALTRPKTSEVTVNYTGFPAAAQTAFEYAAAIMEQQVTSSTNILVDASWEPFTDSEALAQVRWRWFTKDPVDDPNLPLSDVLYPAPLAGTFRTHRLDDRADVEIRVNSLADWYTGTEGVPPPGDFDLVTVAIHEMVQAYGWGRALDPFSNPPALVPSVFDIFVTGGDGSPVYRHDVATMRRDLVGAELAFSGASARLAAGGTAPRLFAPAEWSPGSSVSHLDVYYVDADPDHAMGPFIWPGWAFHEPGPITLAALKDLGWTISGLGIATRVTITNQEPRLVATGRAFPIPISVAVQDPVGARVTTDNTTRVTLEAWGIWESGATWVCPDLAAPVVTVSSGIAAFTRCMATGPWHLMYFRATAPGLAPGMLHRFLLASDVATAYAPTVARTR